MLFFANFNVVIEIVQVMYIKSIISDQVAEMNLKPVHDTLRALTPPLNYIVRNLFFVVGNKTMFVLISIPLNSL